jgi:ABC-type amino acid transport system permease subunit
MDIRAVAESTFDIAYLLVVWWLVVMMIRRRGDLAPQDCRVGFCLTSAFLLLALGDTAHVGFRVTAYANGGLAQNASLLAVGTFITSITMTIFYVFMLFAWQARFRKPLGLAGWLSLGAAVVRLIAVLAQVSDWGNLAASYGGSLTLFRNLPLFVLGIGVLTLMWSDGRRTGDRLFQRMAQFILVSFAFYTPVILFYTRWPAIGTLMIPKTMAYLAVAFLAYRGLYTPEIIR